MSSILKNSWYLNKPIHKLAIKASKGVSKTPLMRIVDDLETFGKHKGEIAKKDLKNMKTLSFYEDGRRVSYILGKGKKDKEMKPLDVASSVVKTAKGFKDSKVAVEFSKDFLENQENVGKFVYGCELSNYGFHIKGDKGSKPSKRPHEIEDIEIEGHNMEEFFDSENFKFYKNLGENKNYARKLANARINFFDIPMFLEEARNLKKAHGEKIELEILEDQQLLEHGMNLNYAVGQGSANRPAFINMTYLGDTQNSEIHAIIGKGVVFDNGGNNIKPTGSMEDMYMDKGGASAVFGAFKGIVELGLKVNVTCSIPLAENAVSSTSYRPSDIITSLKGITVEIGNTDAEGRLILADAMTWTQKRHAPTSMIELSTLTGACLVALGERTAGLFSNDKDLSKRIKKMGKKVGEPFWKLPIPDEIKEGIKNEASDVINSTRKRYGGASEAAAFLELFVEKGVKWAHLDIAGPASASTPFGNYSKGCTGFGVGVLMQHFREMDQSK